MGFIKRFCQNCGTLNEIKETTEMFVCSSCGCIQIIKNDKAENISSSTEITEKDKNYNENNDYELKLKEVICDLEQCDVVIKMLYNGDYSNVCHKALLILEKYPSNKLAEMIYKLNFEVNNYCDNRYTGYTFNEQPVIDYFLDNSGFVNFDLSLFFAVLLIKKCVYTIWISECMEAILENIMNLNLSDEILYKYFNELFYELNNNSSSDRLKDIAKEHKSAAWINIFVTGSAVLSAAADLVSDEAKKIEKEIKIIKDELREIVTNYLIESKLPYEQKCKFLNSKTKISNNNSNAGCYIATAVYGSYDCPEVWCLRRYRDFKLSSTFLGRLFIKIYYTLSPTMVKWFGDKKWFKNFWKKKLDKKVSKLRELGYEDTKYEDKNWKNKN